ncbi:MAG TPA: NnrU family protein [Geminicoccaceae bacterium]|nr:NnrU family protein [Geminicoccaceae bacterium]
MIELLLAAALLLATHYGVSATPLRGWLVARLGERASLALYALLSLAILIWLIVAYRRAPYVELWPMAVWSPWVPLIVMPFALLLLVCGIGTMRPSAIGAPGTLDRAEPARGMLRVTRHPFMWGVALWALAHMVPNGDAAAVVLFGTFAGLALLGTRLIDRKLAARHGAPWRRFAATTSNLPFAAILAGRQHLDVPEIGWLRPCVALALYALLLALHPWLFGLSPFGAL